MRFFFNCFKSIFFNSSQQFFFVELRKFELLVKFHNHSKISITAEHEKIFQKISLNISYTHGINISCSSNNRVSNSIPKRVFMCK